MINYLFCVLGIIIIGISIFYINKEFKNAVSMNSNRNFNSIIEEDEQQDMINSIETIERIVEDLNEYFCNTVISLEEKYNDLEYRVDMLNNNLLINVDKNLFKIEQPSNIAYEKKNDIDSKKQINNIDNSVSNQVKNLNILKIFELKNKGLNTQQIAKELNIGIGEVQLVLNINKK